MRKRSTQKFYFGVAQEEAVVRYLNSDSEKEKNKIFEEYLKEPLIKMVESIIRRYKLNRRDITFQDSHSDTISFLMTKIDRFNPDQNHKAYSYFGTICKNYLMGTIQKEAKEFNRTTPYEDISTEIEESIGFSYNMDESYVDYKEIMDKIKSKIDEILENTSLNENERKLGESLVYIFDNFEEIFDIGEGSKFNKNLILLFLREMTSLSTKDIRISIKKFRYVYDDTLFDFLNF